MNTLPARVNATEAAVILRVYYNLAHNMDDRENMNDGRTSDSAPDYDTAPNSTRISPSAVSETASLVGRHRSTVQRIVRSSLASSGSYRPAFRGSQPKYKDNAQEVRAVLSDAVNALLARGICPTREMLRTKLHLVTGISYSLTGIGTVLKRLGFTYKRLKTMFLAHNQAGPIRLRGRYLSLITSFRDIPSDSSAWPSTPVLPEVYIDESYFDTSSHGNYGWTENNAPCQIRPRSTRIGIIGAGIALCNPHQTSTGMSTSPQVTTDWVPGSLRAWSCSKTKSPSDPYRGSCDSRLFETWFTSLATTCTRKFGPCVFILDNASYHRRSNRLKPKSSRKADLATHLSDLSVLAQKNGGPPLDLPAPIHTLTVRQLRALCKTHAPPSRPVIVDIAHSLGHKVLYTPPYHPELQPIETIWAVLKSKVRLALQSVDPYPPPTNAVVQFIHTAAEQIGPHTWDGARKKVLVCEQSLARGP